MRNQIALAFLGGMWYNEKSKVERCCYMKKIITVLYVLLVLSDITIFTDFRGLIFSFLLSKRNIKSAKKIHSSKSFFDRFTLNYVKEHAIYPKAYKFFHNFYLAFLITFPIQYTALITTHIFSIKAVTILLVSFVIIKLVIGAYLRLQVNPGRIYKFDKRY